MCGICGFMNKNGNLAKKDILYKMMTAISHRGPDGEGCYIDDYIALGHRRLSIIDLTEAGRQPMASLCGKYVITYNGELYNFLELKAKLERLGYTFRSKCDTEVVLYSYIEWGYNCLDLFDGMFAFSIYDKENEKIFCARDRYGIKPFYYYDKREIFIFASEQKAIYTHPLFKHELDLEALIEYFTFQNIFTDRTFEKDIKVLEPGCFFYIDKCTEKISPIRYWDYYFQEQNDNRKEADYEEELCALLQQAVDRQMVSNTEVGCFLSGGIDSGTIACMASKKIPHIKTFTCGYDMSHVLPNEMSFDERKNSEIMARAFKTEHYEMVLQPSDIERSIAEVCFHIEEPRVGQAYANYYIANMASKFVKVCFSGVGGDELFGGYPWRYYRGMYAKSFEEFIDSYYSFWQRLIPDRMIKEIFAPIWDKISTICTRDIFRGVFKHYESKLNTPVDYINYSLYFEAKTFLPGLLHVEDKLTMAHGLEARVPMLDNALVDFAMNLPIKYKIANLEEKLRIDENDIRIKTKNYYTRTNDGKVLLRKAMSKFIPEEIERASKQGFSAPDGSWFRDDAIDFIYKVIFSDETKMWKYMDKASVRRLVNEHIDGKANRRLLIWSLLNFDVLLKTWYN